MKRFPRVLIVAKSKIGDIDSAGGALRNWFREWPRDRLAQIFSGVPTGGGADFCGSNFLLGAEERRLGRLFFALKRSRLADGALPGRSRPQAEGDGAWARRAARRAGEVLVETGLWELMFPPKLSGRMRAWLDAFRPDVLFTQGADISFMRLPLMIGREYRLPIHFDVVDDWVEHLYGGSWAGPLVRPAVQRAFRDLLRASACRYTIGEAMAEAYRARYGVPFRVLMQCDDPDRFSEAIPARTRGPGEVEIVYSGSLALNRWKALMDLAEACEACRSRGLNARVTAYVTFVPEEASALRHDRNVTLKEAVPDAEVPGVLKGADILFLPESFDPRYREYVKLSVSTKAHLYMLSGRPSLVYGPPGLGTIEYARQRGWGLVVDQQGQAHLADAIERLVYDPSRRQELVARGREVAARNHAGPSVREDLRESLVSCG